MATPLQFESFSSAVDATFWHSLASRKVDVYQLDESEQTLNGYYLVGGRSAASTGSSTSVPSDKAFVLPSRLCLGHGAFDESSDSFPPFSVLSPGTLRNTNTIEAFKAIDKTEALASVGKQIWADIVSGAALQNPSLLTRYLLITFADLKKYKFYFWFAFPAFSLPELVSLSQGEQVKLLKDVWAPAEVSSLYDRTAAFRNVPDGGKKGFFLVKKSAAGEVSVGDVSEWKSFWQGVADQDRIVGFCDPGSLATNPGWPLRNFLVMLKKHFGISQIQVICYRETSAKGDISPSLWLRVDVPGILTSDDMPKCVGWEKNIQGKLGPRLADLAPLMDPLKLADTAVDLNLKLMRWRIMPEIQLEKVSQTKCLLLGSGTLGCYVARALLYVEAWGIRHITFVDNGVVSFSNPVRQPLFTFDDCLNGGKSKAQAAADGLKKIFPGVVRHFPSSDETFKDSVGKLTELIAEHDAVFLLTDSREARWLPTVLGAKLGKIVITSAIGFDTFVVMRHGMRIADPSKPEHTLGCYFCNDVVAPRDSLSDRTLDQQCTVSRPGLALLASAQAVELLVSLINHPEGAWAAADTALDPAEKTPNFFGLVPHQIRGYLSHFSNLLIAGQAYNKCIACSQVVLKEYEEGGLVFLKNAISTPKFLEELTGLADLYKETDAADLDWDDDDE
ncbi:Autophagy protein 7 [Phlyctochytrium planicorne]|nr:Autophagy protein 7 [Phlyctochytrium planicorne]